MAVVVHVDLCTNRSGLDNSTHQSRPHNPFLKDNQRKTAEWANSTTQNKTNIEQLNQWHRATKEKGHTHKCTKRRVCASVRRVAKHARHTDKGNREVATVNKNSETRGHEKTLTIIAAPVYVDAASVVAGKLGEGETCGVGCGQN